MFTDIDKIYLLYCKILDHFNLTNNDNNLYHIGENFNYYYADDVQSDILIDNINNNLIEIDIKSAFPTLCNILFKDNKEFINKLNSIDEKLQKNIFISNYFKQFNDINYLKLLNNYCKIIIFGYVLNNYNDINIIEYKKDSILFTGNDNFDSIFDEFNGIIENNGINFHINNYNQYIRLNNTSIFCDNNYNITSKGKMHDFPEYINLFLKELLVNNFNHYDIINKYEIKKIYSLKYFKLLYQLKEFDFIKHYYMFGNNKFLYNNINFNNLDSDFNPVFILNYLVFPILFLIKTNN